MYVCVCMCVRACNYTTPHLFSLSSGFILTKITSTLSSVSPFLAPAPVDMYTWAHTATGTKEMMDTGNSKY